MLLTTPWHLRELEHCAIAADVAAWLAAGNEPEVLPIGLMRTTTARERINPSSPGREERAARRAAEPVVPTPRAVKARVAKLPKLARPGSQKALILLELLQGPVSAKFLAGAVGCSKQTALEQVRDLRERGLLTNEGRHHDLRWALTPAGTRLARTCGGGA